MSHAASSFVIALSGGSGSGKSTVADALLEKLGPDMAVQFHEDAYYWPMSHYGAHDTDAQRAKIIEGVNYDDPASKDCAFMARDLAQLKKGEHVDQPVYDYGKHDRAGETHALTPAPIIILEGIHVLSVPEIEHLIDLSIYVDTPVDLRLARRLRRDVVERKRDVEGVLRQYVGTVRPAHYRFTHPAKYTADLVIADEGLPAYGGVRPSEEAVERMLAPILERLYRLGVIDARTR